MINIHDAPASEARHACLLNHPSYVHAYRDILSRGVNQLRKPTWGWALPATSTRTSSCIARRNSQGSARVRRYECFSAIARHTAPPEAGTGIETIFFGPTLI